MTKTNPFPRDTAEWYRAEALNTIRVAELQRNGSVEQDVSLHVALIYATLAASALAYKEPGY